METKDKKKKQVENHSRSNSDHPIVTEHGNGRSCFVAEYCSNAVCDPAWINFSAVTYYRILSVLFLAKRKGKEKDRMLCQTQLE